MIALFIIAGLAWAVSMLTLWGKAAAARALERSFGNYANTDNIVEQWLTLKFNMLVALIVTTVFEACILTLLVFSSLNGPLAAIVATITLLYWAANDEGKRRLHENMYAHLEQKAAGLK